MIGCASDIVLYLVDKGDDEIWELTKYTKKKKRTLSQNALYWQLIGEVAAVQKVTNNFVHNMMLRDCAQPIIVDGQLVRVTIPDTEEAEDKTLESTTVHLKPTSQTWVGNDGVIYRTYVLLKGSSEMNTREFTLLVDNLIKLAHSLDIETISDEELAYIRELENSRKVQNG